MRNKRKAKIIIFDMLLNLIGTGLPLLVLQLVVYPKVAQISSEDSYGQMLSAMSVIYLVGGTLGGTLSTVRLVNNYDYESKKIEGDFKLIYFFNLIFVLIVTPVIVLIYYDGISLYHTILITVICLLNCSQNYLEVGYRLEINYKRIFINKLLTCIGYLIGYFIFIKTTSWEYIFIISYLLPVIQCLKSSKAVREQNVKTELFSFTFRSFLLQGSASLLNKSLTYFDKLLLYPLLGGWAVSVYYVANIFGKMILKVLEPINNVILSYLAKRKTVSSNVWKRTLVIGGSFCVVAYIICMLISKPVIIYFYPQWSEAAVELIPICTVTLCVSAFISIITPLSLKTLSAFEQLLINGISLIVYISLVIMLFRQFGLMGCSIALLVSYIAKLLTILFLTKRMKKRE